MGALIRIRLRVLLPFLAVSLVASGTVAVGIAGVSGAGSYLIRQADNDLLACAGSMLSHRFVAAPVSSQVSPAACGTELLSAGGQVLTLAAPGTAPGPTIPSGGSWLAAHVGRPVTAPGAGTSGRWRVLIEPVRYQPQRILYVYGPDDVRYVISGGPGRDSSGMLVMMAGLAGTGRLPTGYAVAAGTVLVLLAGAAFALTQAILRPLREAAELAESAGQAAAGGIPRVMSRRGVHVGREGNDWPFGTTLTRMPEQLRASHAAEVAARRSADQMSEHPELSALHVALLRGELGRREENRKTNLRAELTSFVGKDADVAAVRELIAEHRLTTVIGPGGSGKTRLATETARTLLGDLPDGAWLVELASIGADGDVAQSTLAALGLRDALLGDEQGTARHHR